MADSLLDIGGESEFPIDIDWGTLPKNEFNIISRYLYEKQWTSPYLATKDEETPIIFEASFYLGDKETEYSFLDFIHTKIGRARRFWVKFPRQMFILTEPLSNGSDEMKVQPNNFDLFCVGHERIYILMNNGDLITRHVTAASYDDVADEITLSLATAVNRDISLTDYFMVGRYLLVRFDSDEFNMDIYSDSKSSVSVRFTEAIGDYADLAENP